MAMNSVTGGIDSSLAPGVAAELPSGSASYMVLIALAYYTTVGIYARCL
jgi:hypothetical protein